MGIVTFRCEIILCLYTFDSAVLFNIQRSWMANWLHCNHIINKFLQRLVDVQAFRIFSAWRFDQKLFQMKEVSEMGQLR